MRAHVCGHMFFWMCVRMGLDLWAPAAQHIPAGLSKSGKVPKRSGNFLQGRHLALGAGICFLKVRPVVQFPSPDFRVTHKDHVLLIRWIRTSGV